MNDPIKIIYKYKNDNNKVQYQYYIFLGSLVPQNIRKILSKIEKLNFFTTLTTLVDKEIYALTKFYGEYWYTYFFLSDHLTFSIDSIIKSSQKRSDLIRKFSKEWYDIHIASTTQKFIKRSEYSYASIFERNMYVKFKNLSEENDDANDYKTKTIIPILDEEQTGGAEEQDEEPDDENDNIDIFKSEEQVDVDEFYDIEELSNIYKAPETVIDENPDSIKNLISKALEKADADVDEKKNRSDHFDKYKSGMVYDDILKRNFDKKYIYNQYIFKNDTIKTIKQKITTCIENNDKYSKENPYIIPSRMYLWSEYELKSFDSKVSKIDKIMLGHKWVKKNELLSVDIEPNTNLSLYESLKGNLKLLNDGMKKYGSKIRYEDDENNILDEYDEYYTNNELYMIDIYNELGQGYKGSHDQIKNLYQVYCKIYFPNLNFDEFTKIIDYVNLDQSKKHFEENIVSVIYQNIYNDLLLEKEIMNTVEQIKIDKVNYLNILKSNYIIQATIHVNLSFHLTKNTTKINLYRIFDSFVTSEEYPFLQYQINTNKLIFKFYQEKKELDKDAIASKWLENSPYGINFKIKVKDSTNGSTNSENKYIAVSLFETGRLEYKTTWKEDDKATYDDILNTYDYIKNLIKKINSETSKVNIIEPENHHFKYAFINSIQHFELPDKHSINHNELSDFARFFYPYTAVVIEPRKRMSKKNVDNSKSKYGTYLRYKRISKFDNEAKIENRIIYFLRNYEFIPKVLGNEIAKQFNITEADAIKKIEEVVNKYPLLKKSRKILKKLQNIPKFKPPGIAVDIQGKKKENYKIRIDGARSQKQLTDIIEFMTILLWLYNDTYINKNPERIVIKNLLKSLTNIASRRNKVEEIVVQPESNNPGSVKELAKLDHERLGNKVKGDKWSRVCQKSGKKNRRPEIYTDKTFEQMMALGYKLNKQTGDYERTVSLMKNGKKKDVIIRAAKFTGENSLYYTCSPEENQEYMFIGFLSRSNENGVCIPCCYKKDPSTSKNKFKQAFHFQCLGKNKNTNQTTREVYGDKLYILQDTNKMLPGRFGYLYKYLDYYFNTLLNKSKVIKNNYLVESKTGYYMKYGSSQDRYPFLNAISTCINMPVDEIINKIKSSIDNDSIWTFANSGDLKTQFKTKELFIETLTTNEELDHYYTNDIISIPGVIDPDGLNIYIFERKEHKTNIDFILLCKNIENIIYNNDQMRQNIILIKEELMYFPVMLISKTSKDKSINVKSIFSYSDEIITHIKDYSKISCNIIGFDTTTIENAKTIYYKLFSNGVDEFIPVSQIIDNRNKCIFLVTKKGFLIPVKPSGTLYNLPIVNIESIKLKSIEETLDFLNNVLSIVSCKPIGFITDSDNLKIIAISITDQIKVPVIEQQLKPDEMDNLIKNYTLDKKDFNDIIDEEIKKGPSNYIIDDRIEIVNKKRFSDEHYELFRYELSNYLNLALPLKNQIIKLLESNNENKKNDIKMLLLKNLSDKTFEKINNIENTNTVGGASKFLEVNNDEVNTNGYTVNNNRELCMQNKNSNDCNSNVHCIWNRHCMFRVNELMLVEFISRVSSELINNTVKSKEILNLDEYYVLDVIDINNYTYREKQKIVKSDNMNIKKILGEIFGTSNIPIIGKRRLYKNTKTIYEENIKFPLEKVGNVYYQTIINENSLFRAYSNCIYWYKNNLSDVSYRNLGYYSTLQTELANTFKSHIYNWLNNNMLMEKLYEQIKPLNNITLQTFIDEYRTRIFMDRDFYTMGIVDLLILNYQHNIPIIIYDFYDTIILIIDDGIKFNGITNKSPQIKSELLESYNNKSLKIKFKTSKININSIPEMVQVIY